MSRYIRYETSHYKSSNTNVDASEYKDIHYLIDFQIDETIDMEKEMLNFYARL